MISDGWTGKLQIAIAPGGAVRPPELAGGADSEDVQGLHVPDDGVDDPAPAEGGEVAAAEPVDVGPAPVLPQGGRMLGRHDAVAAP